MNWWIGIVFAAGSVLFPLGSVFSLVPDLARMLSINSASISRIFFVVPYRLQPLPTCSCFKPPTPKVSCPAVGSCKSMSVGFAGARVTLAG
jgi:hypothetical protein